jgi:hypothetical protein
MVTISYFTGISAQQDWQGIPFGTTKRPNDNHLESSPKRLSVEGEV